MRNPVSQDNSPRTAQPRFSNSSFDCELPPEALDELVTPKRPRILGRPGKTAYGPHAHILAVLALVLAVGVVIALWNRQRSSETPVVAPAPAVQSAPTPAPAAVQPVPGWHSDGTGSGRAGTIGHSAPRAQLVRMPMPAPRAQLVRLPPLVTIAPEHIDQAHAIRMPYGETISATLRGFLDAENQLPQVGRIGDMYVVGTVPWIWTQVPGTTAPTWVDP